MQPQLNTSRLALHLLTDEDHPFVRTLVNTKGWLEFIGDRNVHSEEDAVAYIRKINGTENLYYWVVRTNDSGMPVGVVTFIKRTYFNHFDIGFAFLPAAQGQGYAFEAASEVLSMARQHGHSTVLASTLPHNADSIRLITKLGLQFEKEMVQDGETLHVYRTDLPPAG